MNSPLWLNRSWQQSCSVHIIFAIIWPGFFFFFLACFLTVETEVQQAYSFSKGQCQDMRLILSVCNIVFLFNSRDKLNFTWEELTHILPSYLNNQSLLLSLFQAYLLIWFGSDCM